MSCPEEPRHRGRASTPVPQPGGPGACQLDYPHDDVPVPAARGQQSLLEQLVDLFDEMEFLVERQVAGELVAAVGDLDDAARLVAALGRVDLDDPDLVRSRCRSAPGPAGSGRTARPSTCPPSVRTAGNRLGIAAEASTASAVIWSRRLLKALELPGQHIDRADQQHRQPRIRVGRDPRRSRAGRSSSVAELVERRDRAVVGADGGSGTEVLQRARAEQPRVDQALRPGWLAEFSVPEPRQGRPHPLGPPSISADQASSAHTAPPDVPLSPTTS